MRFNLSPDLPLIGLNSSGKPLVPIKPTSKNYSLSKFFKKNRNTLAKWVTCQKGSVVQGWLNELVL